MENNKINDQLVIMKQKYELERRLEKIFLKEGYSPVEVSFFEDYEAFSSINRKFKKESLVKILNGYDEVMVVRPDITTNLIKQFIPKYKDELNLKLFYNATVFLNEMGSNIQEHRQMGIEYLGKDYKSANREVINLALTILRTYNDNYILEVGNSKFLAGLLSRFDFTDQEEQSLTRLYNKKNIFELEQFVKTLDIGDRDQSLLIAITTLNGDLSRLGSMLDTLKDYKLNEQMKQSIGEVIELRDYIHERNRQELERIHVDFTMAPRFDYYDGIVFRGIFEHINEAILTGGRYDALTEYYGKKVPAMGFSIAIDALIKSVYGKGGNKSE